MLWLLALEGALVTLAGVLLVTVVLPAEYGIDPTSFEEMRPGCFDLAERIPGPSTDAFQALAKRLGVVIVASLFEKRAEGLYHNTAVIIDADGSLLGRGHNRRIQDADPSMHAETAAFRVDLRPAPEEAGREAVVVAQAELAESILRRGAIVSWRPVGRAVLGLRIVAAARARVRSLPEQEDFNRAWPGTERPTSATARPRSTAVWRRPSTSSTRRPS